MDDTYFYANFHWENGNLKLRTLKSLSPNANYIDKLVYLDTPHWILDYRK